MDDKTKLLLIKQLLESCLEFDGDKGQVIDDVLCVISFGEGEQHDDRS